MIFEEAYPFKGYLFCANAIRKGAIGYIGATDESGYLDIPAFLAETFAQGESIGKAFINTKNSMIISNRDTQYVYESSKNPMPWYVLLGDPTLKLITVHTMPKPQLNLISNYQNEEKYKLIIPAMRIEIPEDIKNLCQIPGQVVPLYFITAYNSGLQRNTEFCSRIDSLQGFQPVAISPFGWTITKESGINGDKLWIHSPTNDGYTRYFTTANSNSFTNFEFDVVLLDEAPDLIIDEVSLSGRKFSFKIKNIGNKDITNLNYIDINLVVNTCNDESCSQLNFYYSDVYYPFVNEPLLPQAGYKNVQIDIPNKNIYGDILNNGEIIRVYLAISDKEKMIIQQDYTNEFVEKIMVVS